ncbi:hypothetical protein PsorP6_005183 [Peronosclerospora sorghi]|uniref:Uncharacterized protein n=1 Tax=Peronosclerospora sorghi TaxID=230839 RepID=A0ACC0W1R5_9STRA|nr:hypothetical protein PsorP6_005183 [Peronosclerospora sorghi]
MGLADQMNDKMGTIGKDESLHQWEPDHEPPMDDKPDTVDPSCVAADTTRTPPVLPTLDGFRQHSSTSGVPKPLAPLNHHNQLTRFMAKQTLGYIPKLSVRSPERTNSPPSTVYGTMPRESGVSSFDSPRGNSSPTIRLPSLTPPLSPQKWASPPLFNSQEDTQTAEDGRPSLPALSGSFMQRSESFSETCSSPVPPLKRQHTHETHHSVMSIADLCQPFRYMRASSCPSDTNQGVSNSTVPSERTTVPTAEQTWRPALEPQVYVRAQSCSSDVDTLRGSLPHSGISSLGDEFQHRLERSSSMDAPTLVRHLKRTAAESIVLTQWLNRPCRGSLSSLADSADSMHQLEQAGRSMRISDSPRSDTVAPHDIKREKKLCAFPQCSSNAVTRGLCISHGGGRRCQRKGCTRGAQSKGLCVAHGGGRICRATGCSNIQRSMGLCIRHGGGRRCSVKGCQKGVVRQDLCTAHGGKRKCRVADCTKHVKKKGLCRSHANSLFATLGAS